MVDDKNLVSKQDQKEPDKNEQQNVIRLLRQADNSIVPTDGWEASQNRLYDAMMVLDHHGYGLKYTFLWRISAVAAVIAIIAMGLWVHALQVENTSLRTAPAVAHKSAEEYPLATLELKDALKVLRVWKEVSLFFEDTPAWVARAGGNVQMGVLPGTHSSPPDAATPIVIRIRSISYCFPGGLGSFRYAPERPQESILCFQKHDAPY